MAHVNTGRESLSEKLLQIFCQHVRLVHRGYDRSLGLSEVEGDRDGSAFAATCSHNLESVFFTKRIARVG